MKSTTRTSTWVVLIPLLAVAALMLASCSSSDSGDDSSPSAGQLTVTDAWVKATDGPMTGVFGVITNDTGQEVTIVTATTSASDKTELHETVDKGGQSVMQVKPGGVTIPANSSTTLQPGGNHIMVMNAKDPIKAGDEVTITLNLAGGETVIFKAQAKESAAGDEPYHESPDDDGDMSSPSASMDRG